MYSITTYKNAALDQLSGNWGSAALVTLIAVIAGYAPTYAIALSLNEPWDNFGELWTLLVIPLFWSYTVMFLRLGRGRKLEVNSLFDGYSDFVRIFLTKILQGIYTMLWTLLLIIPGIVKAYSYAMTDYVLEDNPSLRYNSAIEESMRLMRGHKMDLFLLDLSFIGWVILSAFTLGIGFFFLYPYWNTTRANFYEDLKREKA